MLLYIPGTFQSVADRRTSCRQHRRCLHNTPHILLDNLSAVRRSENSAAATSAIVCVSHHAAFNSCNCTDRVLSSTLRVSKVSCTPGMKPTDVHNSTPGPARQRKQQEELAGACTDPHSSEAVSVESPGRDTLMRSPAEEEFQLESALQCEEQIRCLSTPPTSDTSAQSFEDSSIFYSSATAANIYAAMLPVDTFRRSGLSPVKVPAGAIWEPDSILSFGESHQLHSACLLTSVIGPLLLLC